MKVRCIANTGDYLKTYELSELGKHEYGRFGATSNTIFGGVEPGEEYSIMGMILGQGTLAYLFDCRGSILSYPSQLFDVMDHTIPSDWYFTFIKFDDERYPYQEAIWGYYELVFDNTHLKNILLGDETASRIYFRRKIEKENNEDQFTRNEPQK